MTVSDSYIALCREASLERSPEGGDYVAEMEGPPRVTLIFAPGPPARDLVWRAGQAWLPRLDQLLDLLGGNAEAITLLSLRKRGWVCQLHLPDVGDRIGETIGAKGATPEEAALRCYLALQGKHQKKAHGTPPSVTRGVNKEEQHD